MRFFSTDWLEIRTLMRTTTKEEEETKCQRIQTSLFAPYESQGTDTQSWLLTQSVDKPTHWIILCANRNTHWCLAFTVFRLSVSHNMLRILCLPRSMRSIYAHTHKTQKNTFKILKWNYIQNEVFPFSNLYKSYRIPFEVFFSVLFLLLKIKIPKKATIYKNYALSITLFIDHP